MWCRLEKGDIYNNNSMPKKCDGRIVHVLGVLSAITVVVSGLWSGFGDKLISDYLILGVFAIFAYIPFALLGFIIKRNAQFLIFLVVFGVFLFGLDMYAKYDAFFGSPSSTGGLVNAIMPIFLLGATFLIWGTVEIIAHFTNHKTQEDDLRENNQ